MLRDVIKTLVMTQWRKNKQLDGIRGEASSDLLPKETKFVYSAFGWNGAENGIFWGLMIDEIWVLMGEWSPQRRGVPGTGGEGHDVWGCGSHRDSKPAVIARYERRHTLPAGVKPRAHTRYPQTSKESASCACRCRGGTWGRYEPRGNLRPAAGEDGRRFLWS